MRGFFFLLVLFKWRWHNRFDSNCETHTGSHHFGQFNIIILFYLLASLLFSPSPSSLSYACIQDCVGIASVPIAHTIPTDQQSARARLPNVLKYLILLDLMTWFPIINTHCYRINVFSWFKNSFFWLYFFFLPLLVFSFLSSMRHECKRLIRILDHKQKSRIHHLGVLTCCSFALRIGFSKMKILHCRERRKDRREKKVKKTTSI